MKPHPSTLAALTAFVLGAGTVLAQTDKYWTGTGTWGTDDFWSLTSGGTYDQPWVAGDNAIFEGTPGTVTLGAAITANDIDFTVAGSNYLIDGNSLNMAGGSITVSSKNRKHTITSAITGSPAVNIINGTGYEGLTLAPTSGTVALGTCTVPYDDPVGGDKAGIRFGGSTTGNTVSEVTYQGGDRYGAIYVQDTGEWTFGNVLVGIVYVQGGDMIANGEIDTKYAGLRLQSGTLHYNNEGAVKGGPFNFEGGSLDNTSGAAITTSLYNPAQSWMANWTFLGSNGANSDLNLGTGAVTLTGTRTVTVQNAATTLTIDGVVGDTTNVYGVTKDGPGTLKLTNANTYNGSTTVSAGTLSLGDGTNNSNLDDNAILEVATGATLDLNFTSGNVDAVFALTFNGSLAATGTWGRTGHPDSPDNESPQITGDGLINNLGGAAPAGTNYWDGANVGGNGNGNSDGGSGVWDTSTLCWDVGLGPRVAWPDTTADKAIFRTAAGTVTLDSDITLGEILIDGVNNYTIGDNPENNSLNFGGATNKITVDGVTATIRAGITGSPEIHTPGGSQEKLYLTPDSADMTIGDIHVGLGSSSNPVLYLRGSTHGNTVSMIQKEQYYTFLYVDGSGTWTVGDLDVGVVYLQSGTLIVNGTWITPWSGLNFTGGTLGGSGTINDNVTVPNNGGLTFDLSTDAASHDKLEIAGGTNTLNFAGASELTITSSGGASPGVYTLVSGVGNITGSAPATVNLPPDWAATVSISGADLLLTVTSTGGGGTPYEGWAGGAAFDADDNGDGVDNGMAWILGAASPSANALDKLPVEANDGTYLTLDFTRENPYAPAKLYVEYGTDLSNWTKLLIRDDTGTISGSDVEVVVTTGDPDAVTVKIPITHAVGGKLFARLSATEN